MSSERKTQLTWKDRIKAAYLHHVLGYTIQEIASAVFDGINHGRVSEACGALEEAAQDEALAEYKQARKRNGRPEETPI